MFNRGKSLIERDLPRFYVLYANKTVKLTNIRKILKKLILSKVALTFFRFFFVNFAARLRTKPENMRLSYPNGIAGTASPGSGLLRTTEALREVYCLNLLAACDDSFRHKGEEKMCLYKNT